MNNNEKSALLERLSALSAGTDHAHIEPTIEQFKALVEADSEGPWHFVNLFNFYDKAQYPAGHELADSNLTGEEAYSKYGEVALEQVSKRGGQLITINTVQQAVIGSATNWQRLATIEYPSIDAFLDMIQDPDYRAALVHRDAGLKETTILATKPLM